MPSTSPTVQDLAPRTEDEVREHLAAGKLVEKPALGAYRQTVASLLR